MYMGYTHKGYRKNPRPTDLPLMECVYYLRCQNLETSVVTIAPVTLSFRFAAKLIVYVFLRFHIYQ